MLNKIETKLVTQNENMANSYLYLLLHYQNQKRRNAQVMLIAHEMLKLKSTDKKKCSF